MPRDLFGDVQQPAAGVGSKRRRYTVPLSLAAHALAILAIAAATVLGPVVLPGLASSDITYVDIALPTPPPPPRVPRPVTEPDRPLVSPNAAPTEAPDQIRPELPASADFVEAPATVTGIAPGGMPLDTVVGDAPVPPAAPQKPVPVGGHVRPPAKVRDVAPIYPAIAQAARVEGTVIIEATIDTSGHVQSTRVLRSIPLLDDAALAAVGQWVYTPTLLNGTPVPVVMTVTVTFRLR